MTGIRIIRRDVFWTYGNLFLSSGVNVLLLPVILWALNSEEVGLWYVYSAIGGLSLVLDLGLTTTLSRHVTYCWFGVESIARQGYAEGHGGGEPNLPLLRGLVAATKVAYRVVGAVALVLALTVGTLQVQHAIHATSLLDSRLVSWWVYVVAIWVNTSMAYWNPLLRGIGAVAESGQANVAGKLSQLVLTSAALFLGFGLTGVAVSFLASTIVFRIMSMRSFHERSGLNGSAVRHPEAHSRAELLRSIWPNALRQGVVSLSQYVMAYSPVLVASSFLGLRVAASVGLTVQIVGIVKVLGNALFNALLPQLTSLRLEGDVGQLRSRLALSLGTASYTILVGGVLALVTGPVFLNVLGSDVALLALGPGLTFLASEWAVNQYALTSAFISTANRVPMHRAYALTAVSATAGQVLAVTLLDWGVWGVVIPPLLASAVYNDWAWFRRASSEVRTGPADLLVRSLWAPVNFTFARFGGR